jgi:hypothetical protein
MAPSASTSTSELGAASKSDSSSSSCEGIKGIGRLVGQLDGLRIRVRPQMTEDVEEPGALAECEVSVAESVRDGLAEVGVATDDPATRQRRAAPERGAGDILQSDAGIHECRPGRLGGYAVGLDRQLFCRVSDADVPCV